MDAASAPVTRSVPKPTVLRKEPGNFDSEVSAYYLQYGLKVKLDIKVVQFIAIKNKPSLPYQRHMVSNYSFREEKEILEGLKSIDSEASQQLIFGKLNMKDVQISNNYNLPLEISRIECTIKFLYRSNLKAEKGIVEIKPLVDRQTITCLAYFQYSDLYKQQEQDFQCKDLAVLMPVSNKDKFCVSVHLWKNGYQVPYIVTAIWNETLRIKLAMPEPRPAPWSAEVLSYREPLIKEIVANCQDEIEVVNEAASTPVTEVEQAGFKKIKIPASAGKATAGLIDLYQDFISIDADGSVVEYFDNCEGTVEKVIGEHYLVINLSKYDKAKKVRVLATSADIIASYDPDSLDSMTKISNAKAAHTGINLYDLAQPGDNVRFNAVLLAADDSTIQYCTTCVVIDPKRYMAKLVGPVDSEDLVRPLPMPRFVPLLPVKSSKPFGNTWKETYQKVVSLLDGNLNIEALKNTSGEAVRILSINAPSKCAALKLRPCPNREKVQDIRKSMSLSLNEETEVSGSKDKTAINEKKDKARAAKRGNLIYLTDDDNNDNEGKPSSVKLSVEPKSESESSDKYDPYEAQKIYGRVIKILNPNYGIGICQIISDDGTIKSIQVLFDIFDVWIDDQVVAKMNKKLPDVMVVGDYLQMLCIKVEECDNQAKRVVEHMATAVAIAKSYKEVKTKRFPSAVVPLEKIELIDESKIDNFRKVVKILKGMEPDKNEKSLIEDLRTEMKKLLSLQNTIGNENKSPDVKVSPGLLNLYEKKEESKDVCAPTIKTKDTKESFNELKKLGDPVGDVKKLSDLVESSKSTSKSLDPPKAVFGLSFSKVAKDHSQDKKKFISQINKESMPEETASSCSVISIFTVKILKNIEGSFWLGYTTNELNKKGHKSFQPKRVIINAVLLEKNLLIEEGMILNCDISDVEIEDPKDNNQVYHIANSVKLNPNEEIILDDKRWKQKTKQAKYQPIVENVCNLEFSNVQCCHLLGMVVPDFVLFFNKTLPRVLINQTGVVVKLVDDSSAIIRLGVNDKSTRGTKYLHILADNSYRSMLDQEFHPSFVVGYPVTFHAVKLKGNEDKNVQYLATDICLHLDPKRYADFLGVGNPVSIESVLAFPTFKQVIQKLSLITADTIITKPDDTSYSGVVGRIKALDDEIILIEHSNMESKSITLYNKTKSERAPKTVLMMKEGQEVIFNYLNLKQDLICGLVTEMWTPQEEAKESMGYKNITVGSIDAFNQKVSRIMNPARLQHLIPQNFIKFQSKYNKDDLQRLISQYVEALEENVELEGVSIAAPLSFQNIVSGAKFEIILKDAKQFLMLLGDICQESIGPKKEAYWDIALDRDLKIGDIVFSSSHAVLIKEKGLTNAIKLLPRTRKNLLSWRYPEEWVKNAEKYSSFGIDASSFADCPQAWSRVDDSKLLAGALEHGLLFEDLSSEKSWANLADDLGYGLGSRIFKEGTLQPFVLDRLGFLRRIAEGRGRFCYECCEEDDNTLQICEVSTIKGEVKAEEEEPEAGKTPLFSYDLNSTGSSSVEEATVIIKEEYFEVDDALSLPAVSRDNDDLDEMEKSLNTALEEMEKAAALVEESFESELDDQLTLENLEKSIVTPFERPVINNLSSPSEEVEISEPDFSAESDPTPSIQEMNGPSSQEAKLEVTQNSEWGKIY